MHNRHNTFNEIFLETKKVQDQERRMKELNTPKIPNNLRERIKLWLNNIADELVYNKEKYEKIYKHVEEGCRDGKEIIRIDRYPSHMNKSRKDNFFQLPSYLSIDQVTQEITTNSVEITIEEEGNTFYNSCIFLKPAYAIKKYDDDDNFSMALFNLFLPSGDEKVLVGFDLLINVNPKIKPKCIMM